LTFPPWEGAGSNSDLVLSNAGVEMSKRAVVVVDLQNEYLPTGKLPLVGIDQALENAARVIADAREKGDLIAHVRHEFTAPDAPFFKPGSEEFKFILQ
jgi:nicotinamidase-related amidase